MGSAFFVGEEHFQAALNAAPAEGKDCPLRIHWRGNAKVVAAAQRLQVAFLLPVNGCSARLGSTTRSAWKCSSYRGRKGFDGLPVKSNEWFVS